MPTEYAGVAPLSERIIAADVILAGRAGRRLRERSLLHDPDRVAVAFEVRPESVWKGKARGTIEIRVWQRRGERHAMVTEGGHYVLLLARDSATDEPAGWYVPYFGAAYPIHDGRVQVPAEVLDSSVREAGLRPGKVSLAAFRKVVAATLRQQAKEQRRSEELVPPELRARRGVTAEMPNPDGGAGRSAAPGRARHARTEKTSKKRRRLRPI